MWDSDQLVIHTVSGYKAALTPTAYCLEENCWESQRVLLGTCDDMGVCFHSCINES